MVDMLRRCVVAALLLALCAAGDNTLARQKLTLRILATQTGFLEKEISEKCPGYTLNDKRSLAVDDLKVLIQNREDHLRWLLLNYNNCTRTTVAPPVTLLPINASEFNGKAFVDTSFFVKQVNISKTYEGTELVFLQVTLPENGMSTSANWCSDYQRLCAHFGRRPVGCHESFLYDQEKKMCSKMYNATSDVKELGCASNWELAKLIPAVFPYIPSPQASFSNSLLFHECDRCTKYVNGSTNAVTSIAKVVASKKRLGFTVCY